MKVYRLKQQKVYINDVLKALLYFFIMLYPIVPINYYIFSINLPYIVSLIILFIFIGLNKKIVLPNFGRYNLFFWLYLIVYSFFSLFTDGILSQVAWILSTIMVSLILIQFIKSEKELNNIIQCIVVSSFILGILGIFESIHGSYLFQGELLANWVDKFRYGLLRCTVFFGHPINFGFYQVISASLIFFQFLNKKIKKNCKLLFAMTYLIDVICIFFTVSRLVIIFYVLIHFIMVLHLNFKKRLKYFILSIVLGFFLISFLEISGLDIITLILDFFTNIVAKLGFSNIDISQAIGFGNRLDLYSWVLDSMKGHFLFGYGVEASFLYYVSTTFVKNSIEVQYLYILYKCGFIGLSFLVCSYLGTLFFFNKYKHIGNYKILNFSNFLFILFLIYYVCLFGVQETDLIRLYCELIAMGIAFVRYSTRQEEREFDERSETE